MDSAAEFDIIAEVLVQSLREPPTPHTSTMFSWQSREHFDKWKKCEIGAAIPISIFVKDGPFFPVDAHAQLWHDNPQAYTIALAYDVGNGHAQTFFTQTRKTLEQARKEAA